MALASARTWGHQVAVIDGEAHLSFQGVADIMVQVARGLIARGVQPGDRVAIWAPNAIAWIPVALGVQAAGAWLVPLNTRLLGEEAAYILAKTDARALFTVQDFLGVDYQAMLMAQDPNLRALGDVVQLPLPGGLDSPDLARLLADGSAVEEGEVHRRIAALTGDDICDIMFTSGTTSMPKGVLLRHGASLEAYRIFNRSYGMAAGSHCIITTPFFHCFGYKAGWMMALDHGAVSHPVAVFDGRTALAMIQREGITHMGGSPTMFQAMLDDPERDSYDLSSLDSVVISATTVPEHLVHRVRDELGVEYAITGYGLTENHGFVSVNRRGDAPHLIATTAGRVIDEIEAVVVDDDGDEVEPQEQGELWVKGFMVTPGYYDDPEATAAAISDGWLHTGDIVTMNEDRYLRITDRKKDIYIMGGFNVAPAEVENVIAKMEGVAQVAVVGAPDPRFGEVGAAFVIPRVAGVLSGEEVIDHCRRRLANYKVPRHVIFVDAFPLNAMGKVLKRDLRDRIREEQVGA